MPHYIALGKGITSPRGIISGGALNSEVTWKTFCRDPENEKLVEISKKNFARHIEVGTIIETDAPPGTPESVAKTERARLLTQEVDLAGDGKPVGGLKASQAERAIAQGSVQNVPLTDPVKTEAEIAEQEAALAKAASQKANVKAKNAELKAAKAKAASNKVEAQRVIDKERAAEVIKKESTSSEQEAPPDPPAAVPIGAQKKVEDPLNPSA